MSLNLTIKQLRYAETAGRLGSIAAAAGEHNISQSSITAAIDAMEAALGFDLFIRQPAKGIMPTPSGNEALKMIANILRQHNHFEGELEALGGAAGGVLRVGCYITVAPGLLPKVLGDFSAAHPEAQADISEGDMIAMMDLLGQGVIDIALTYELGSVGEVSFLPLFKAPPYALLPDDDPLATRASVSLADLADRPFIMLDLPHTRDYFEQMFRDQGLHPKIAHSSKSSEIVRSMVAGKFGVSILNIRHSRDTGYAAVPLTGDLLSPTFGIAMLKGVRPPLMSRLFIDQLERLQAEGAFDDLVVAPPAVKSVTSPG